MPVENLSEWKKTHVVSQLIRQGAERRKKTAIANEKPGAMMTIHAIGEENKTARQLREQERNHHHGRKKEAEKSAKRREETGRTATQPDVVKHGVWECAVCRRRFRTRDTLKDHREEMDHYRKGTRGKREATGESKRGRNTTMEELKQERTPITKEERGKQRSGVERGTDRKTHAAPSARIRDRVFRRTADRNYAGRSVRDAATTKNNTRGDAIMTHRRSGVKHGDEPRETGAVSRAEIPGKRADHRRDEKSTTKNGRHSRESRHKQRPSDDNEGGGSGSSLLKTSKETTTNWNEIVEEEKDHQSGVGSKNLMGPDKTHSTSGKSGGGTVAEE